VNFVLGGILMGFEGYLMPFMALQGLRVNVAAEKRADYFSALT